MLCCFVVINKQNFVKIGPAVLELCSRTDTHTHTHTHTDTPITILRTPHGAE